MLTIKNKPNKIMVNRIKTLTNKYFDHSTLNKSEIQERENLK